MNARLTPGLMALALLVLTVYGPQALDAARLLGVG